MILLRNLFFLAAITIFAVASTILTIYNYSPYLSDKTVYINFYASFLFAVAGIVSLLIFGVRERFSKRESKNQFFWPSVREGVLFSTAGTTLLLLQGLRILDWLIGISIMVVAILLELFFQTKRTKTA